MEARVRGPTSEVRKQTHLVDERAMSVRGRTPPRNKHPLPVPQTRGGPDILRSEGVIELGKSQREPTPPLRHAQA